MRNIFLFIVCFIDLEAMSFEEEFNQRKNDLPLHSSDNEEKLLEFEEFLSKSDLSNQENQSVLKTYFNQLEESVGWYNTHIELGGPGKNKNTIGDLMLVTLQSYIREQKSE